MPIFESGPSKRRFWSDSTDPFPTEATHGNISTSSLLQYYDTGDRFIYDKPSNNWYPFVGEEDLLGVLEEIRDSIQEQLPILQLVQTATAIMANDQTNCFIPTGD